MRYWEVVSAKKSMMLPDALSSRPAVGQRALQVYIDMTNEIPFSISEKLGRVIARAQRSSTCIFWTVNQLFTSIKACRFQHRNVDAAKPLREAPARVPNLLLLYTTNLYQPRLTPGQLSPSVCLSVCLQNAQMQGHCLRFASRGGFLPQLCN